MNMAPRFHDVDAIVFDFDGTLVDSREAIYRAFVRVLADRGREAPGPEWMRRRIGRPLRLIFDEALGALDAAEEHRLVSAYRAAFVEVSHLVVALPGAARVVEHFAARIPLGIATSRTAEGALQLLDGIGLRHGFRAVVGIEHISRPKPDPEPVERTLALLGVAPARALMVGDTPDDVVAAQRAGVRAIAVASGGHDRHELQATGADAVFDSLDELRDAVPAAQRAR